MKTSFAFRLYHSAIRTFGGVKRRPWLHALSFLTLIAAFLSLGATLTAALNIDHVLDRWMGAGEITIYVKPGTSEAELDQLTQAVRALEGVESVEAVTVSQAHETFVASMGELQDVASTIPADAFPASVEIAFADGFVQNEASRKALAARIAQVGMVESVDIYGDWYDRISALNVIGRLASWGLGILSFAVAVLVIGAIIRAGLFIRRDEVEALKLFGASSGQIKGPFVAEGALQATLAMGIALVVLAFINLKIGSQFQAVLPLIGGGSLVSMPLSALCGLVVGSAVSGILGAGISLRSLGATQP